MDKGDVYQALTLWFVIFIFIEIGPKTSSGLLVRAAGMVAIALLYLIPGFLIVDILYTYTNE
jgi:hypothetical protein